MITKDVKDLRLFILEISFKYNLIFNRIVTSPFYIDVKENTCYEGFTVVH
jgi:hypothetical protein